MTAQEHARLLGIFHLIQAGLQIFSGIIIVLIYIGLGGMFMANAHREEEQFIGGVFLISAVVIGIIMVPIALLYAYSGWKLFKNQPHSKVWAIIVSVLSLPGIPLGTALGVYGLWFTCGDAGKAFYEGKYISRGFNSPPPPPNSWQ